MEWTCAGPSYQMEAGKQVVATWFSCGASDCQQPCAAQKPKQATALFLERVAVDGDLSPCGKSPGGQGKRSEVGTSLF